MKVARCILNIYQNFSTIQNILIFKVNSKSASVFINDYIIIIFRESSASLFRVLSSVQPNYNFNKINKLLFSVWWRIENMGRRYSFRRCCNRRLREPLRMTTSLPITNLGFFLYMGLLKCLLCLMESMSKIQELFSPYYTLCGCRKL